MSENKTEVTIGALVLAVAIGFVLYVGQTTGISASTGGYQISAAFRSAQGISTGTDVRLAGVKIGTVGDIALNPETYRAEVTFAIQEGIEIPDDSTFAIDPKDCWAVNMSRWFQGDPLTIWWTGMRPWTRRARLA